MAATQIDIQQIAAGLVAAHAAVLAPVGAYTPIFLDAGDPSPALASVNAGNSPGLWIGGAGINAAFGVALGGAASQFIGQQHLKLIQQVPATAPYVATEVASDPSGFLVFSLARLVPRSCYTQPNDGAIFIDVLGPNAPPAQDNPSNAAMAYVCPPQGNLGATDAGFLDAVAATAQDLVDTLRYYNTALADTTPAGLQAALPVLARLRMCMFSAGIYRQRGVSAEDVAEAIGQGMLKGLATGGPTGLTMIDIPGGTAGFGSLASAISAAA